MDFEEKCRDPWEFLIVMIFNFIYIKQKNGCTVVAIKQKNTNTLKTLGISASYFTAVPYLLGKGSPKSRPKHS